MFAALTHSVDIYRLVKASNKEAYDSSPIYSAVDCGIIPSGTDTLAVYPSENYSLYDIFIYENVTIKGSDKLKTASNEWIIRGVPQVFDLKGHFYIKAVGEKVV